MRIKVTTRGIVGSLIALALLSACDMGDDLEVRTFPLENLRPDEAARLVEPYVFFDREGAAGSLSHVDGAITVRETSDNLAQIERVLAEYDQARSDVRLYFQLIEADGFTESDPRIASVEEELRQVFQFRGYRLAGEGFVSTTDGSEIGSIVNASDGPFEIQGHVYWSGPQTVRLDELRFFDREGRGSGLQTTVNIRPGQTLILGSSPKPGSTATLLLTVRAEEVPGGNE